MISGTGSLSISDDAAATAVNVGTGGADKTVIVGSSFGTSSLALQAGSASISYNNSLFSSLGAILTTATDGFLYVASCAGAPTGVPTSQGASGASIPLVIDTSTGTGKLWAYIGGSWVGIALA